LAIDPETFALVAHHPQEAQGLPLPAWGRALQQETVTGALPAIVSRSLLTSQHTVGRLISLTLGNQKLPFVIRGIADNFSTLSEDFVVTDWRALGQYINLNVWHLRSGEIWLATDPAQHNALARHPTLEGRILADVETIRRSLQSDATTLGVRGLFQANSGMLALLGVVGCFFLYSLTIHNRSYEFGLLSAMGLGPGRAYGLLVAESMLVVGISLLAGCATGYGLARAILPFLSRALVASLGSVGVRPMAVDWSAALRMNALLASCYLLAMGFSLWTLPHLRVSIAPRLSEE
jgi:hypothetical protein